MSYKLKHHSQITKSPKHRADNPEVKQPVVKGVGAAPSHARPGDVVVYLYGFNDGNLGACERFETYLTVGAAQDLARQLTKAVEKLDPAAEQRDAA